MEVIDESIAQELQEQHLRGEPRALVKLYSECVYLGNIIADLYIKRTGIKRNTTEREDAVHAAVSSILSRYHNGYRVRTFSGLLHLEVKQQFTAGKKSRKKTFNDSFLQLDDSVAALVAQGYGGSRDLLEELRGEPSGERIFVDLCMYRSYRDAIITIAGYVSPSRILSESSKLYAIHTVMHGRKAKSNGQRIPRDLAGDQEADSIDKRHTQKGRQAHPLRGSR